MKTDKKIDITKIKIVDGELIKSDQTQLLCPIRQFEKCTPYTCAWFDGKYNQCAIVSIGEIFREQ